MYKTTWSHWCVGDNRYFHWFSIVLLRHKCSLKRVQLCDFRDIWTTTSPSRASRLICMSALMERKNLPLAKCVLPATSKSFPSATPSWKMSHGLVGNGYHPSFKKCQLLVLIHCLSENRQMFSCNLRTEADSTCLENWNQLHLTKLKPYKFISGGQPEEAGLLKALEHKVHLCFTASRWGTDDPTIQRDLWTSLNTFISSDVPILQLSKWSPPYKIVHINPEGVGPQRMTVQVLFEVEVACT